MPTRFTKQDRIAHERYMYHSWLLNQDGMDVASFFEHEIPAVWHTILHDWDVDEPSEKITLYLDKSVARGFKAMGRGYHKRINRILQSWLQLKIMDAFKKEEFLKKHKKDFDERWDVVTDEDIWEDEEVKRLFAMRRK